MGKFQHRISIMAYYWQHWESSPLANPMGPNQAAITTQTTDTLTLTVCTKLAKVSYTVGIKYHTWINAHFPHKLTGFFVVQARPTASRLCQGSMCQFQVVCDSPVFHVNKIATRLLIGCTALLPMQSSY